MNAIAEEAERYKMDAVALQEIRWKGKGTIRKSKFTVYYSGNEDRQGNRGVGFIVSKKVNKSVLGFSPICERICTLRIKGKLHTITFVTVCAPTEGAEGEIVDEFYETLQSVCDELAKHNAVITLGDFNAKLGKEQIYRMSQEECARLWESVPYVKVYRYNPKHLCPKLNGYGDNDQRKVWSSCGSTHCTCQLTILSISVLECGVI